jgi:hypothetical protein
MKNLIYFLLVICGLFGFSLAFAGADVQVLLSSVEQEDSLIVVTFGLVNQRTLGGLQFDLEDAPDVLEYLSCAPTGRLAELLSLSLSGSEREQAARFIWFSLAGDSLQPGSGDELIARFRKSAAASGSITLTVSHVYPADPVGGTLTGEGASMLFNPVTGLSGKPAMPTEFALEQNFPNPFNPNTEIKYAVPVKGLVSINIYNLRGALIRNLVSREHDPGYYRLIWDAQDDQGQQVASGMYICKLETGGKSLIRKMMLTR